VVEGLADEVIKLVKDDGAGKNWSTVFTIDCFRADFSARCRANSAQLRQSSPDSGLGFPEKKSSKTVKLFPLRSKVAPLCRFGFVGLGRMFCSICPLIISVQGYLAY
jgi:hypothetical protein